MNREAVLNLWEAHKNEGWPRLAGRNEGPLMTLDIVISGCVVYFLDGQAELDEQRRAIVGDCLVDLEALSSEIDDDCRPYFQRLRDLGTLLLLSSSS